MATESQEKKKGFLDYLIGLITALGGAGGIVALINYFGKPPDNPPPPVQSPPPETRLNEYLNYLSSRQLEKARGIYPSMSIEITARWLDGRGSIRKSPIRAIGVVAGSVYMDGSSENSKTLFATVRFCREDKSGTDERKEYRFYKEKDAWYLSGDGQPSSVRQIRC